MTAPGSSQGSASLMYLLGTTFRNRARAQLARLRQPRYAIALLIGLAYIGLIFYRPEQNAATPPAPPMLQPSLALGSAFLLAVLTAKWWIFGASTGTLAFTPAEIQFLFPAPIPRRDLVLYRVIRVQFSMLVSALFIALLIWRGGSPLPVPLRVLGLWVLFATTFMHQMGVTLVRTAAAQRGRGLRRSAPALALVGICVILLGVSIAPAFRPIHSMQDAVDFSNNITNALRAPLPSAILLPFHWLVGPAYARSTDAWVRAIGPAVVLLILHYVWVLRADATFQDAALDASARRAVRLAARAVPAVRAPRRAERPLVPLASSGPAWSAIVWKNMVSFTRSLRVTTALRFTIVLLVALATANLAGLVPSRGNGLDTPAVLIGGGAMVGVAYLALVGPLLVRNDLRGDLAHLGVLRTYPLRGRTIVFAEILSSAATLTVMQIGLALLAFALFTPIAIGPRASILAGALVVLPAVNLTSLTIQNAVAILIPGWTRLGAAVPEAGQVGFEAVGQRALAGIGSLLALAISLAPPTGAAVGLALLLGGSIPAVTAGVIAGLAVAAVEIWLAVLFIGRLFDRTDAVSVRA